MTGANRGLGKDVLRLLMQKNPDYHVVATARAKLEELQAQVNSEFPHNHVKFMQLDIQHQESTQQLIYQVLTISLNKSVSWELNSMPS